MEGTPAGWYDDPEQPGQQRYWDGNAWTEQRSPGPTGAGPTAPPPGPAPTSPPPPGAGSTPPPPGAGAPTGPSMPPPGGPAPAAAKKSRTGLWVVLGVVGGLVVLAIIAVVAIAVVGGGDDATDVVEKNLPQALEDNFTSQGIDVTVSKVECDSISNDEGPFTTSCMITIDGLADPLDATVLGDIDGNTVNVDDVQSPKTILTAELAATQAQPTIDEIDPTVSITSCQLDAPVVVVEDGMTFTCDTDSNETVTFEVDGGTLTITDVS